MVLYCFILYTSHSVIPHFISLVFKCRVDSVADFEGKGKPFVIGQSAQGRLAHLDR